MKGILLLLLLAFPYSSEKSGQEEWYCNDLKGTYQIEVLKRGQVSFPSDLCQLISDNRRPDEQAVISIGDFVRVRIQSSSGISSGFTFRKEVVYVAE